MPTYHVSTPEGMLEPGAKAAVAAAIIRAHADITGAPASFAQVVFHGVAREDLYVGGRPVEGDHIHVEGRIRAGRSAVDRKALVVRLIADVAAAAAVPSFAVWVYLQELPSAAMAEFGHVLPEAGDEPAWTQALPAQDRERLQAIEAAAPAQDDQP